MEDNIDCALGQFLALLEQRGELERTLIVFSSDHGEHLGDHGKWGKSTPYAASTDVPLLCAGPGVARGHTVSAPTTLLDLPATFLDAAGLPVPRHYQSRSLSAALAGGTGSRPHVHSGLHRWRLVRDARYKLARTGYATARHPAAPLTDALYDLATDPHELTNLAADPAHQPIRDRLAALLP
jgi:arylsulfatase A-like enzyme